MFIRAVQHRRPRRVTGIAIGLGMIAATIFGAIVVVGAVLGGFEIDANGITSNAGTAAKPYYNDAFYTQTNNDWVKGTGSGKGFFQLAAAAATTGTAATNCYNSNIDKNPTATDYQLSFICDGMSDSKFSGKGNSLATQPEKDGVSPAGKQIDPSWPIKAASVNAKDDFSHAMLAFTRTHTSPCAGSTGHDPIIYLAGDRGDNEGDAFWGFEFDQVAPDNFDNLKNHTGTAYNLVFHRTPGDILVSFTNTGGGDVLLEVFVWNGSTFVLQAPITGCPPTSRPAIPNCPRMVERFRRPPRRGTSRSAIRLLLTAAATPAGWPRRAEPARPSRHATSWRRQSTCTPSTSTSSVPTT